MTQQSVRLILADIENNNNKFWEADLNEDGSINIRYGRVGKNPQTTNYGPSSQGEKDFLKKIAAKKKKGYTEAKVISSTKTVEQTGLTKIAKSQIRISGGQIVSDLVERLVKENIHKITSNTNIKFDESKGLFQSPLGIVTVKAIDEARNKLAEMADFALKSDWRNPTLIRATNDYLRLIPRDIGMRKFNLESFFSNVKETLGKENDTLDSLKSSYEAFLASDPKDEKEEEIQEKVFDLSLSLADNQEYDRVKKWFEKSKKTQHRYGNIKIDKMFKVDSSYNENFDNKIGNIQEVFHGTNSANSLSILKSGLKISPPNSATIAGKLFGNGVYGSQTSSKSLGYCMGRWGQGKGHSIHIYVLEFAMGKPFYPNSYGISKLPKGYNSCWATPEKTKLYNDELIVYKEDQIKIKYLIECKA